eukprot:353642-Chlamydomonas_euryale.AAC.2
MYLREASIALSAAMPVTRHTCMFTEAAGRWSSQRCSRVTVVPTVCVSLNHLLGDNTVPPPALPFFVSLQASQLGKSADIIATGKLHATGGPVRIGRSDGCVSPVNRPVDVLGRSYERENVLAIRYCTSAAPERRITLRVSTGEIIRRARMRVDVQGGRPA